MISRPLAWVIALTLAIILAAAWWAGRYPARLTIINSSGTDVPSLTIDSGAQHLELGSIASGSAKRVQLQPGELVTVRTQAAVWTSPDKLTPGGALVIYVQPAGRIESRSRLGSYSR